MSLLIIGALTASVAMFANNNEDSPLLWGVLTFITGFVGAILLGWLGAIVGCGLLAAVYFLKVSRFG